jgi:hypothetical protein
MSYRDDLAKLIGRTLARVDRLRDGDGGDMLLFVSADGGRLLMHHSQDCCETVEIEDIAGDLNDLVGVPILVAESRTNEAETEYGHSTWTFYTLRTMKGTVDIRWHGSSNGYYSESVDCDWQDAEVAP